MAEKTLKKDKKKDPIKEIYDMLQGYEDGYKPRDFSDYEM